MKNIIFEEEKKFDSGTQFFWENCSQLGVFWPRQGLQANHGTVRKSAIFPQPSNQKQLKVAKHSFWRAFADAVQRAHKDFKKQTCHQ